MRSDIFLIRLPVPTYFMTSPLLFQIIAARYELRNIHEPVSYSRDGDGFNRVVIFREEKSGHYGSKMRFHAVQVEFSQFTLFPSYFLTTFILHAVFGQ